METKLKSGRVLHLNAGLLSCDPSEPLTVYGGYDDVIHTEHACFGNEQPFTAEERDEIAALAFGTWEAWLLAGPSNAVQEPGELVAALRRAFPGRACTRR